MKLRSSEVVLEGEMKRNLKILSLIKLVFAETPTSYKCPTWKCWSKNQGSFLNGRDSIQLPVSRNIVFTEQKQPTFSVFWVPSFQIGIHSSVIFPAQFFVRNHFLFLFFYLSHL